MKPETRDNLIYLAVGLAIVAVIVADLFYAESHNTKMWMPSRFAFRAVITPTLIVYFVVKQMRKEGATPFQTLASVLFATLLQLGIMFTFRRTIDQLPGLTFATLAVFETVFVVLLSVRGVLYLMETRK